MLARQRRAWARLGMVIVGEAVLLGVAVAIASALYGGRQDAVWLFALLAVLLVNAMLAGAYPLFRQQWDYPIETWQRDLRGGSPEEAFKERVRQAHAAVDRGEPHRAYRSFIAALEQQPENTDLMREVAELCEAHLGPRVAIKWYRRIVDLGVLHSSTLHLSQAKEKVAKLSEKS